MGRTRELEGLAAPPAPAWTWNPDWERGGGCTSDRRQKTGRPVGAAHRRPSPCVKLRMACPILRGGAGPSWAGGRATILYRGASSLHVRMCTSGEGRSWWHDVERGRQLRGQAAPILGQIGRSSNPPRALSEARRNFPHAHSLDQATRERKRDVMSLSCFEDALDLSVAPR